MKGTAAMRRQLSALRRGALQALRIVDGRDLILVVGTILVSVGLWQVYEPLAYIVPGALLLLVWAWTSPLFRKGG